MKYDTNMYYDIEKSMLHEIFYTYKRLFSITRFLRQWLMVWQGKNGNIHIASANKLPYWEPARILLPTTEEHKW